MPRFVIKYLTLFFLLAGSLHLYAQTKDRLLLQDSAKLASLKRQYQTGDVATITAVNKLLADADKALNTGPFSVTLKKTKTAPSGNIHDYVSQAPYWWADPSKPDGKPYIRKDGERNPEIYLLHDDTQMGEMCKTVKVLGFAYYFTGKDQYAQQAADLLTTWFINPNTRMAPNLNYAQYVPGVNDGRGTGIIESRGLSVIPDALAMMQDSKSIRPTLNSGIKQWFGDYLKWLLESKGGKDEQAAKNNHGTMYDMQVVDFALFTGDVKVAREAIMKRTIGRMETQFTTDGKQPLELARTKSWGYSNMNLDGWVRLALLSDHLGIDLWQRETKDGKSIKKCLAFLMPYLLKQENWTYQQIEPISYNDLLMTCYFAAGKYPDLEIQKVFTMYPAPAPWM